METPAAPASQDLALAARRPRVLLVEDHPINRQTVQIMLGDRVDLHVATDGGEGVEAAGAWDFDVILMDTDMPRMNGLDATRAIRAAQARNQNQPAHIILITGVGCAAPADLAASCGADQHLARPITEDGLIAAIARHAQDLVDAESLALLNAAA